QPCPCEVFCSFVFYIKSSIAQLKSVEYTKNLLRRRSPAFLDQLYAATIVNSYVSCTRPFVDWLLADFRRQCAFVIPLHRTFIHPEYLGLGFACDPKSQLAVTASIRPIFIGVCHDISGIEIPLETFKQFAE